ncbi:DUF4861 domain-containing protein [Bacteroides bouchesdurhonensis]|uniref:DUF4861 domain-containing protein n=1 Tax=Bacteroides bouchesdurhonensis TaxID=1841855 RepID=UPI0022E2A584|nr:DUF4861 domain-containing protein [Bacteroides bouchesdurhonensis]
MRNNFIIIALLMGCCSLPLNAQKQEKSLTIEVSNNWKQEKTDAPVVIKLKELKVGFKIKSAVVTEENIEIPSQLDDMDRDHKMDELVFVTDLPAQGKKTFKVMLSSEKSSKTYPARVYSEMFIAEPRKNRHQSVQSITVPGSSDIYNMIRPHGPVLESELVGYRLYFNEKQTPDIYGKFNKGLEIKESQFYPTDAQLAKGFGDDVLRVFDSCGPGAFKGWNGKKATHITPVDTRTERIISYGPVRVIAEIEVTGWKYQGAELNMMTRYTLYAGHRDLHIEAFFDEPLKNEIFCTGVQDIIGSVSYSDHKGLVGSWGTDWPVNDTVKYAKETVGLGTCIPQHYVQSEEKDKDNYLYTVGAPQANYFDYYTTFTSMKETFGYKTPEAWFAYLRQWKEELDHPITIKVK